MNAAWLKNSLKIQYLGGWVGWGVSSVGSKFQNKRQTAHFSYCIVGTIYTSNAMLRGGMLILYLICTNKG